MNNEQRKTGNEQRTPNIEHRKPRIDNEKGLQHGILSKAGYKWSGVGYKLSCISR